jgi:NADPH:quinone reductase-like Zn-dependent oxidoreductase
MHNVVSLVGPPDAAFGRARGMNLLMLFVLRLLSRKVHRVARQRDVEYSFLFVHPDGGQLARIDKLLEAGAIRPVIDEVFPFDRAKQALAYVETGRAKGKVVVQIR